MIRILTILIAIALAIAALRIPMCSSAHGAEPVTPGESIYGH